MLIRREIKDYAEIVHKNMSSTLIMGAALWIIKNRFTLTAELNYEDGTTRSIDRVGENGVTRSIDRVPEFNEYIEMEFGFNTRRTQMLIKGAETYADIMGLTYPEETLEHLQTSPFVRVYKLSEWLLRPIGKIDSKADRIACWQEVQAEVDAGANMTQPLIEAKAAKYLNKEPSTEQDENPVMNYREKYPPVPYGSPTQASNGRAKGNYFASHNEAIDLLLPKMGHTAYVMWSYMLRHSMGKGVIDSSKITAKDLHISQPTFKKEFDAMRRMGFFDVDDRGTIHLNDVIWILRANRLIDTPEEEKLPDWLDQEIYDSALTFIEESPFWKAKAPSEEKIIDALHSAIVVKNAGEKSLGAQIMAFHKAKPKKKAQAKPDNPVATKEIAPEWKQYESDLKALLGTALFMVARAYKPKAGNKITITLPNEHELTNMQIHQPAIQKLIGKPVGLMVGT